MPSLVGMILDRVYRELKNALALKSLDRNLLRILDYDGDDGGLKDGGRGGEAMMDSVSFSVLTVVVRMGNRLSRAPSRSLPTDENPDGLKTAKNEGG